MGDLRVYGAGSRRRPASPASRRSLAAGGLPAGVPNHLLARSLTSASPPAGPVLQRVFKVKKTEYRGDDKLPTIHGASRTDLQKLAQDDFDYGTLTDKGSVAAAMARYEERHRAASAPPPLDQIYAGYRTVWQDEAFADHDGSVVRATFQLDAMQGKHDVAFAADKDARKKAGGTKMPAGTDYPSLAQGVPAELTRARLAQIFAKKPRVGFDFSVQKAIQDDGYQYEISAMWEPVDDGIHLLVYYHCYPPE